MRQKVTDDVIEFDSRFDNQCENDNCEGWMTKGKYNTQTTKNGKHFLNLSVALISPVPLNQGAIKQTWAISSGDKSEASEVYSCIYVPKATKKWKCTGGVMKKPLKQWYYDPFNKALTVTDKMISKKPTGARVTNQQMVL